MRQTLASSLLCVLLALGGSACVVNTGGSTTVNETISLSFAGAGCAQAGVGSVRLSFPSGNGSPQTFNCIDPMAIVLTLPSSPSTVRMTFQAFDAVDPTFVAFGATFDVPVRPSVAIDLPAAPEVLTTFTFAGFQNQDGMTCQQAGITHLSFVVDGTLHFDNVACTSNGRDAASLSGIDPGTHEFIVDAFDASNNHLYSSTFPQVVVQDGANEVTLNLLPLVKGGLEFSWNFGPNHLDCANAGISTVEYTLVDASGGVVDHRTVGCTQVPVSFRHDVNGSALDAGLYALSSIVGRTANGTPSFAAASVGLFAPAGRTQGFTVNLGFN